MADLEQAFFAVVREWGQSIGIAGHLHVRSLRAGAEYAVAVAKRLGLGDIEQNTIRLGAYLQDLGR